MNQKRKNFKSKAQESEANKDMKDVETNGSTEIMIIISLATSLLDVKRSED